MMSSETGGKNERNVRGGEGRGRCTDSQPGCRHEKPTVRQKAWRLSARLLGSKKFTRKFSDSEACYMGIMGRQAHSSPPCSLKRKPSARIDRWTRCPFGNLGCLSCLAQSVAYCSGYLGVSQPFSARTSGYLDGHSLARVEVFAVDVRLSLLPRVPVRHQQIPSPIQFGYLRFRRKKRGGMGGISGVGSHGQVLEENSWTVPAGSGASGRGMAKGS